MNTSHLIQRLLILIVSVFLLIPVSLYSQQTEQQIRIVDTIDTQIDLFEEIAPLHFTLEFDLKKFQREKMEGEYMPVLFIYQINDTLRLEKIMRVKARGEFRRSYCSLAPFWLNINKTNVGNKYLQDVKKIKIVTHCNGGKASDEYVLKEYLGYKIYNILSPVSFRVRLIRLTYVDIGRKNKMSEGWAFMIEPEELLGERSNAVVVKKDDLATSLMRSGEMDVIAQFMYMIGNSDFSVAGRHNLKILGLPGFGSEGYTPVPYDFDYSGLVDASYAVPGKDLGITSVRERYFLGPCRDDKAFVKAIEYINQYQDEILQMVNDFEYLDPKSKKGVIQYLEEYYKLAADPPSFIRSLRRTCL
jgi:hypothetical protein